jgi:hypothetical protein
MRRLILAGVVVALTATQGHASCGLLGKLFGGRRPVAQSCQQCQQVQQIQPVAYSAPVVVQSSASCANGQCQNQSFQVGPTRGSFRLFGR